MNPDYMYFKKIDIDQDETFTADLKKKQKKKISDEILELIKSHKELDLTLTMSNAETKTIVIPFVKKMKVTFQRKNIIF